MLKGWRKIPINQWRNQGEKIRLVKGTYNVQPILNQIPIYL